MERRWFRNVGGMLVLLVELVLPTIKLELLVANSLRLEEYDRLARIW